MGIFKGGALRLFQTFLYALLFCCTAVILGVYSYFLAVQADRNRPIPTYEKAVEGLSGAAVLYLIFAVLLTCCLGGIAALAFIAIVLDICFVGAMIAVAVLTRDGADSCKGIVETPLGTGPANSKTGGFDASETNDSNQFTYSVKLGTACKLNTAAFACSLIAALLFLVTAGLQVALVRHHKKEKRYGPGPSNNYTSGSGGRGKFWQRKKKSAGGLQNRDSEMAAGGLAVPGQDLRGSHETGYTGSTVNGGATGTYDKVEQQTGSHTGYYTQPTGTGVNPYTNTTTGTATNY